MPQKKRFFRGFRFFLRHFRVETFLCWGVSIATPSLNPPSNLLPLSLSFPFYSPSSLLHLKSLKFPPLLISFSSPLPIQLNFRSKKPMAPQLWRWGAHGGGPPPNSMVALLKCDKMSNINKKCNQANPDCFETWLIVWGIGKLMSLISPLVNHKIS